VACDQRQSQAARDPGRRLRQCRQRSPRRHRTCVLLAVLLSLGSTAPAARTEVVLDDLLALPQSPAVQTLLMAYAHDARVEARWLLGLEADDAALRGTSARLLGLEGSEDTLPALRAALGTEIDPHVRSELARALVAVGGVDDDPAVLEALRRVEPVARRRVLTALALVRPQSILRDVKVKGNRSVVVGDLGVVLDAWLAMGSTDAHRLMTLVALRPDVIGLTQLLNAASRWTVDVPDEALETAWHEPALLPAALGWLTSGDAEWTRARARRWSAVAGHSADSPSTADDRVLLALRDRWLGQGRASSLVEAIGDLREGSAVYTLPDAVLQVLHADERRALARRFDMTSPARALLARTAYQRAPRGADAARRAPVRLLSDVPAGQPATLRAVTGCAPATAEERVATIRFDGRGRPASIDLDTRGLSEGCARYADALARVAWSPAPLQAGQPARFVIRLGDAVCDGRPRPPVVVAASARELAADLARPRKLSHRAPQYPRDLRGRGVEGTVVIDTRIDDAGCVASAQVIGSLDPVLDVEAVRAVSSWRYAPATIDGTPVPVQMDVAVRFVLK
jgi:TonB family protein